MTGGKLRISICIPHWQAQLYMTLCLRSIRKHSAKYDLEVIVVDNGSHDDSLDYLRSLSWIRLIERPEEQPTNWPLNVFTAWDRGLEVATGDYYLTMHSDVFVKSDDWLDPFLREIADGPKVAATGSWKLEIENPLYAWQKRMVGYVVAKSKAFLGLGKRVQWQQANYPRDYCAMYRPEVLREHQLTFCPVGGSTGGGLSIARQLWDAGYETPVFPVREMSRCVYHIAHGTAAIAPEKRLNHAHKQKQTETKLADLLAADWIRALQIDWTLDEVDGRPIAVPTAASVETGSVQTAAGRVDKLVQMADQFANLETSRQDQPLAHL
jgi:hypothetical protein